MSYRLSQWRGLAVAIFIASVLSACTPQARQDLAPLMPAAGEVSYALHGSRVLSADDSRESLVFPQTALENPRIPIALEAANGDIVAIASIRLGSIGDAATKNYRAAISSDGGTTWSYNEIAEAVTAGSDPSGVVDPANGKIHLVDTEQFTSSDNGRTWSSKPTIVLPNPAGIKGTPNGPGAGIALKNGSHAGRLVIMCRVALPDSVRSPLGLPPAWLDWSDSTNCVLYSDDGGSTWRTSQTVQNGVGEGAVVELGDGTLYMSSRTYAFDGRRSEAWSYDGGETWTNLERSVLPEPYFGVNGSLARVARANGTSVVIYSNVPEWDALFGDIGAARKDLSLYVSTDEARTWRFGGVLHKGPSAYSSLVPIGDDIGVLYEGVVQGINSDRPSSMAPDGIRFARVDVESLFDAP